MARHRHSHHYHKLLFYLSTSLLPFVFVPLLSATAATGDDAAVMSSFLSGLSSPPSGWSMSTSHCEWPGVRCHSSDRVTFINLDSKSLSGTLPADLNSLSHLQTLSIRRNSFSGAFPSLANLSSLQHVYLDANNFHSIPSDFLRGLTSLITLSMSDNTELAPWSLPEDLTQSRSLVTLSARNAAITGSLPDFFHSFPNLQNVRLSYNNLTGSLPASMGQSGILNLWLNKQATGLSGTVGVLSSMTQLTQVWLHKNQFTGPIPNLTNCVNLFDLQLRDNLFTGTVPESLMSPAGLRNVTLDNNKLQGPRPEFKSNVMATYDGNSFCHYSLGHCNAQVTALLEVAGGFGYPMLLTDSWKGNDACNIWSFVTCLNGNVTTLSLERLHLAGVISPAFANLTFLKRLYLSDNNLTGPLPDSLTTLPSLQVLDVSNNNLSGEIPKFPATVKLITTPGNLLLGNPSISGGTAPSESNSGKTLSAALIVAIVIGVIIFVLLVLFVLYKCYMNIWLNKIGKVENPENGNSTLSIQVLREVTNNFSADNILGRGGFGVVYKGVLRGGTEIAVKRMESRAMDTKGMNEFQAEIAVLTKVRHRHLVALLGYCINGNERLLVFEYMPQGTLTHHLFGWREIGCSPLAWKQGRSHVFSTVGT